MDNPYNPNPYNCNGPPPYPPPYHSPPSFPGHPNDAPPPPYPSPPPSSYPPPPHGSFHTSSSHYHSGELRFPSPHSESYPSAPAGFVDPQRPNLYYTPPPPATQPPPPPSSSPMETILSKLRIGSGSFGGSSTPHSPHSSPPRPFGGSHHGQGMQIVHSPSSKPSLKVLLLHGNLDVWINEAKNLPNMDMFSKRVGDMLGPNLTGKITGKLDGHSAPSMTSDPYVSFSITTAVLGRTYVISNSENPVWNQHFYVAVAHHAAEVKFTVKDSDVFGSQLIGTVSIPAEQLAGGARVDGIFPILGPNGKQCKAEATLRVSIQYIPIEMLSMYHYGVGPGPDYIGVRGTYFPLRKGGKVRLYQDAHVPDGYLPSIRMEGGIQYEHGKCWMDICEAISQARRLVYITGWSVYHEIQLFRDGRGPGLSLGDLLKSKSQEGVRVLLLIWDDPTSKTILGYQKAGFMGTHDEEIRKFFKHSSVHVILCPRSAGKRHSWVKQQETGMIYTHHQKTVIVDADAGNNRRKLTAFVGGLDLCDGRYDTPNHPLFRTLGTVHKDDYHNPTFTVPDARGPREPWHDLHSRIDGPAAYDVLKNFEERWLRASKPRGLKKLKTSYEDSLLRIERIPEIIGLEESSHLNDNDPENWHVQIFRSIDSNSVKGFPKDPKEASSKNLACGKNVLVDMSIHTAYVKAIRAAQHFIYIENQYFLGSSYNWNSYKDLGANNLIPMELALKIASKIRSHERFSVYIVIPMWPEGVPTSIPTQRILFWQNKTMQMMYETIYNALIEVGMENEYTPQDYLNFFCLGNREALDRNDTPVGKPTAANTPSPQMLAQKSRRFMIYVHSKGMIVDDEYLIVGSANINQRSLEGTRDTEIAMGAYQPQHTWARKQSGPHGQIHAYRMSLWAEHTGVLEDCFNYPESLECMRRIRTMGELNWKQFISNEVTEMAGHLLKYPVGVERNGTVKPLPGCETFPDVGGNICGSSTIVGTVAGTVAPQENLTI